MKPYFRFSGDGFQLPCKHPHKGGLALSVTSHEGHLLSPFDLHVGSFENHLSGVAYGEVFALEHHVARARGRRELDMKGGIVGLVHLDAVQLLQSLDSALHLIALGGLVTEGTDKVFRLGYHLLLVVVGGFLLGHTLGPKLHELGIRHLVVVYLAQDYLHGAGCDPVEELTVVRNHHHGATVGLQIVFQPFYGLYVQMVRRLVKKQQGRLCKQDLGQLYAHVPALREGFAQAVQFVGQETQAAKHLFGFAGACRGARALHLLDDAAAAVVLHYLGQIAQGLLPGHLHTAGIGLIDAHYQFHHGGLPRPVLAHQAYLFTVGNMKRNAVQQGITAERHRDIVYTDHYLSAAFRSSSMRSGQRVGRPVEADRKPRVTVPSQQSSPRALSTFWLTTSLAWGISGISATTVSISPLTAGRWKRSSAFTTGKVMPSAWHCSTP